VELTFVSLTTICHIPPLCHLLLQYRWDCSTATTAQKCWNKLTTLHTIQALVWQWNARENQNFTVTNVRSIPLCISYYADNDDKGNTNHLWFHLHLASTKSHNSWSNILALWSMRNRPPWLKIHLTHADVHGVQKHFLKVPWSMQIVRYPSQGAKVFRLKFHRVSAGWMQDMRQRQ